MKHIQWTALAVLALVLATAGCAPAATTTPVPILELDPTGPFEIRSVQASARVVPEQEAYLSFVISGPIKEVTVKEGDTVEAGQILAILNSPDLEYGPVEAEAAVRVAELDYEYWKLPRRGDLTNERRKVAEKELERTQRSLDVAHAELAQTELFAPFAATVISVDAKPSEYVQPGQIVIVLAKLNNLKIETTDLSELYVAAVAIGQPATVYIEALDEEYLGEVTAISPISDTIGGDVVYKVTIKVNEQPLDLLWGMSADVEIQTEQ